jgi:DNA primase
MEIAEIKQQLTIGQVLDHYNLSADRNNMLRCPFHDDKTPSLQIYPNTNTFCCFSSNCKAGTGDVIEFIRLKEKSTKREAILKAKSLLGHTEIKSVGDHELSRVAIFAKYFETCRKALSASERARTYATERRLDWQLTNIVLAMIKYRTPGARLTRKMLHALACSARQKIIVTSIGLEVVLCSR